MLLKIAVLHIFILSYNVLAYYYDPYHEISSELFSRRSNYGTGFRRGQPFRREDVSPADDDSNSDDSPQARSVDTKAFDFSLNNSHYKIVHKKRLPFVKAAEYCLGLGGKLAVLDSKSEAQYFVNQLNRFDINFKQLFIGFHNRLDGETFFTIEGDLLKTSGYNEFDYDNSENRLSVCGTFRLNGRLGSYPCHLPLPFICEYKELCKNDELNDFEDALYTDQ